MPGKTLAGIPGDVSTKPFWGYPRVSCEPACVKEFQFNPGPEDIYEEQKGGIIEYGADGADEENKTVDITMDHLRGLAICSRSIHPVGGMAV